jgi:inorganic phosphate transporter, PiT family
VTKSSSDQFVAPVRNLALAWVLTLPMAMILSGLLFVIFRQIF